MERPIVKVNLEKKTFSVDNKPELMLHDSLIGAEVFVADFRSLEIVMGSTLKKKLENEFESIGAAELMLHYNFGNNYIYSMIQDEGDNIGKYLKERNLISSFYRDFSKNKKLIEIIVPESERGNPYIAITGYMKPTIIT